MNHPDRLGIQALEPSVGDLLRLKSFLDGMEELNEAELREACKILAQQVLVSYPARVRWLVAEAAANLGPGIASVGRDLTEALARQAARDGNGPLAAACGSAVSEPDQQGPLAEQTQ